MKEEKRRYREGIEAKILKREQEENESRRVEGNTPCMFAHENPGKIMGAYLLKCQNSSQIHLKNV